MPKKKLPDLDPYPHSAITSNTVTVVADDIGTYSIPVTGIELSNNEVINLGTTERRSLRNRFNDIINVKDFGAKGDDSSYDTAYIQQAANNASGKILFFPEGVYRIGSEITLKPNTTVIGCKSTIKQTANNTPIFVYTELNAINSDCPCEDYSDVISRIYIEHIHFIGKGVEDSTSLYTVNEPDVENHSRSYGVVCKDCEEIVVDNCIFEELRNGGVYVENVEYVTITNNTFVGTLEHPSENILQKGDTNVSQRAIHLYSNRDEVNVYSKKALVCNNKISDVTIGIKVSGGYKNTTIRDNDITNTATYGILVDPDDNLTITNNNISDAYICGVNVQGVESFGVLIPTNLRIEDNNITVSGSRPPEPDDFYESTYYSGIRINLDREMVYGTRYCKNVSVVGNSIQSVGNDVYGIVALRCFDANIKGNTIHKINGKGIVLSYGYGAISDNVLTEVADTCIAVDTYPYRTVYINNNIIKDGNRTLNSYDTDSYDGDSGQTGRDAEYGYIDVYSGFWSTIKEDSNLYRMEKPLWKQNFGYPEDSYVYTNVTVGNSVVQRTYRSVKSGTSNNIGNGPSSTTSDLITDERADSEGLGVKWIYVGLFDDLDRGKAVITGNVIDVKKSKTPQYSLYTDLDVSILWENNKLPINKRSNAGLLLSDSLKVNIQGDIESDFNNVYGGHQLGDAIAIKYTNNANGLPSRNFIGTGAPMSGTWIKADKIWNIDIDENDTIKAYVGWVCVSSGTPGEWEPFGYVGTLNASPQQSESLDTQIVDVLPHKDSHSRNSSDALLPEDIGALNIDSNLKDLSDAAAARDNLGLGEFAVLNLPDCPRDGNLISWNKDSKQLQWVDGPLSVPRMRWEVCGDGVSAKYLIDHDLNTPNILVQVYRYINNVQTLHSNAIIKILDNSTVEVDFKETISINEGRVVLIG
jgi:hypothetical protein